MRNQLLRDTDWASMAHSLEVRVPLVDVTLLKAAGAFLTRCYPAKAILAHSARTPLPVAVTARAKTGFTTPLGSWLHDGTTSRRHADVPPLATLQCHWSRRWAYSVVTN
jgi:asparagine synthase (glutamine-hydrolysing)